MSMNLKNIRALLGTRWHRWSQFSASDCATFGEHGTPAPGFVANRCLPDVASATACLLQVSYP